jgi:hypothetical protein
MERAAVVYWCEDCEWQQDAITDPAPDDLSGGGALDGFATVVSDKPVETCPECHNKREQLWVPGQGYCHHPFHVADAVMDHEEMEAAVRAAMDALRGRMGSDSPFGDIDPNS